MAKKRTIDTGKVDSIGRRIKESEKISWSDTPARRSSGTLNSAVEDFRTEAESITNDYHENNTDTLYEPEYKPSFYEEMMHPERIQDLVNSHLENVPEGIPTPHMGITVSEGDRDTLFGNGKYTELPELTVTDKDAFTRHTLDSYIPDNYDLTDIVENLDETGFYKGENYSPVVNEAGVNDNLAGFSLDYEVSKNVSTVLRAYSQQ